MPEPMGRLPAGYSHRLSPLPTADLQPVERRCQCPPGPSGEGRRPPLRFYSKSAEAVARAGILASSTPLLSYRCHGCKQYTILTAADLGLARPMLRLASS